MLIAYGTENTSSLDAAGRCTRLTNEINVINVFI